MLTRTVAVPVWLVVAAGLLLVAACGAAVYMHGQHSSADDRRADAETRLAEAEARCAVLEAERAELQREMESQKRAQQEVVKLVAEQRNKLRWILDPNEREVVPGWTERQLMEHGWFKAVPMGGRPDR